MSSFMTKQLLDRYVGIVSVLSDDSKYYSYKNNKMIIIAKWTSSNFIYRGDYNKNLVLWTCPNNVLAIEFESSRKTNVKAILETYDNAIKKGFDCCICDHNGKSPYIWIFNIEGLPYDNKEVLRESKKRLAFDLVPEDYHTFLDTSNFSKKNLVPIINHKHWKIKYQGAIHKLIVGKHPLYHKNFFPEKFKRESKISTSELISDNDLIFTLLNGDYQIKSLFHKSYPKGMRSEKEFQLVLLLVSHGLSFFQVDKVMNDSVLGSKWREESHHYRVKTFENARRNVHTPRVLNPSNGVGFMLGDKKKSNLMEE